MQVQFKELNILDTLVLFEDGLEVVEYFKMLIDSFNSESSLKVIQPASLILLDINMPNLDGHETAVRVKEMFDKFNQTQKPGKP